MKILRTIIVVALLVALRAPAAWAIDPVAVPKSNAMKVYMHYMPWFETPATSDNGTWGLHWPMATRNPNIVDATGKRQIASHFYPKIGAYASSDPDVIEYHLLLMKYAGVDGVLLDWYGEQGTNGDRFDLLENSNALVDQTDDFGLKFGVVIEDNFWKVSNMDPSPDIEKAKHNIRYLRDNYFNKSQYIRLGAGVDPLALTFGPQTLTMPSQWTQILAEANEPVNFLPLWYQSNKAGANADGEFAWVHQDAGTTNHLTHTTNFYANRANSLNIAGGAAYPGFDDYYLEGGWGSNLFEIPANNGQVLQATLAEAADNSSKIDFLQLVTWNDFGEGTMLEPTVETGYSYLLQIQDFTGVAYGEAELDLVYRLYLARKEYDGNGAIDAQLEQVSQLLGALQVEQAEELLNSVAPAGDYDGDGDVDAGDYNTWRTAYGNQTVLVGSGADGNYDGRIDAADYSVWRNSLGPGGAGGIAATVPEPSALMLSAWAAAVLSMRRLARTIGTTGAETSCSPQSR